MQQKLFISSNTAKTHITHIYRKMGINSQQRLIDLVDREEQPPAREERDIRDA
ncbi:LuxR C-terminal-related transcriptional regulator [uncultured Ellagibacter sp.]|uniref:LuxR C-terminal-related transcriptional regulator n=1 Tax=uncultured Ellagibacter sp. TaxID=2137580 RepID=UPI002628F963|nr:LuxR C-terminal-related transcriptional regulator [uncultured Ellagibacter sp.]